MISLSLALGQINQQARIEEINPTTVFPARSGIDLLDRVPRLVGQRELR
jgi:hypothetical protein